MKKQKVIEFAKNLFLTPDDEGKYAYTYGEISTEIQQKFNKSIDYSTIVLWSEKFAWKKLCEDISKNKQEAAVLNTTLKCKASLI